MAAPNARGSTIGVPARRHARCEQRLHLRREIERVVVEGIEQRLDAEAIARGEGELELTLVNQRQITREYRDSAARGCRYASNTIATLRVSMRPRDVISIVRGAKLTRPSDSKVRSCSSSCAK